MELPVVMVSSQCSLKRRPKELHRATIHQGYRTGTCSFSVVVIFFLELVLFDFVSLNSDSGGQSALVQTVWHFINSGSWEMTSGERFNVARTFFTCRSRIFSDIIAFIWIFPLHFREKYQNVMIDVIKPRWWHSFSSSSLVLAAAPEHNCRSGASSGGCTANCI